MRTAINTLVLSFVIFGLGLVSPGLVSLVRAEPATCVSGSPGSPACTDAAHQGVQPPSPWAPMAPAMATPPVPAKSARMPTHSFLFPTGNMTPAKEYSFAVHEMGLYNRVAYGVSDHLEISVGAPIFLIVGSLNARVSLTGPESPFRVVVGGSVWTPLYRTGEDDLESIMQGTVTLGYQTERWNLHGSLSALRPVADDYDDSLVMGSAGILVKMSDNFALMADISTVGMGMGSTCSDGCASGDLLRMSTVGIKYMGRLWDIDFGLVFPTEIEGSSNDEFAMLPIVSFHRH